MDGYFALGRHDFLGSLEERDIAIFLLVIFQMYNVWEYEDMSSSPYWTRVMVISLWVVPSVLGKIVPQSNPRSPRCPGPQRKGKI
ncbi:unnamed protein product [Dicrocoelium dendriticum]|nr:unnamed protein product [Dicrocoelium dendriticum]